MSAISPKNVHVSLPAELVDLLKAGEGDVNVRVQQALVLQLFQEGVISSGKAAEMLHIAKDSFRSLLTERGIPYFHQTAEEVARDAEVASSAKSSP